MARLTGTANLVGTSSNSSPTAHDPACLHLGRKCCCRSGRIKFGSGLTLGCLKGLHGQVCGVFRCDFSAQAAGAESCLVMLQALRHGLAMLAVLLQKH